jgi:hypothetical protein
MRQSQIACERDKNERVGEHGGRLEGIPMSATAGAALQSASGGNNQATGAIFALKQGDDGAAFVFSSSTINPISNPCRTRSSGP